MNFRHWRINERLEDEIKDAVNEMTAQMINSGRIDVAKVIQVERDRMADAIACRLRKRWKVIERARPQRSLP